MRVRLLTGMALLCLVVVAKPIVAEETKSTKPGVVIKLRSIADLMQDANFLAKANGKAEEAKQLDGLVKEWVEPSGIDIKRPIGLYGNIGPAGIDSTVVVLVPISNEKAVLEKLEGFNIKADKGTDGIYSLQADMLPPQFQIFLKFADKYAYITAQDKTALDANKLLKPADIIPEGKGSTFSALVDIAQIPEGLKKAFLAQVELGLAKEKDKKDPKGKENDVIRAQVLDQVGNGFASLVNDGGPVSLDLNIDRKTEDLSLQISVAGKPNSTLAKAIADLAKVNSLFAGLHQANSAVSATVYSLLPESMRQSVGTKIIDHLKEGLSKEKNEQIKKHAEDLLEAMSPSIKSGELDVGVDLRGPSEAKQYTLVGGIKIKDGAKVEKAARALIGDIPEDKRAAIKLDVAKVGETAIHQIDAGKELDADARKIFGEGPIFFAVRADAVLFALGDKAQDALKEEIGLAPKTGKPVAIEVSLPRIAPLIANSKANPEFVKHLEKAAAEDKEGLKITATVDGGEALKIRVNVKAKALSLVVPRAKEEKGK
jgi:hypothetical protein